MLKTARYAATPHASARTHKVPIAVIEHLSGEREQVALDGKRCLFEVLVVSPGDLPMSMPAVIVAPSSGGEVRFGKKLLGTYPEEFSPGESRRSRRGSGDPAVMLNSFIVSPTPYQQIPMWGEGMTKAELQKCHVLFQRDDKATYIKTLLDRMLVK